MDEQQQTDDAVAAAAAVLNDLEARRVALLEHGRELVQRRQQISFAAHTGSADAKKALAAVIDEIVHHDQQVLSVEAAVLEAQQRVNAAQREAAAADARANAQKIHGVNDAALEHSVVLSDALHDACMAINNLKACWDQFGKLGVTSPHHQQLKVNIVNVISGVLSSLPWDFQTLRFSYLPMHQRVDVEGLFRKWHAAIEQRYVLPHLGEVEPAAALPDDLSIPQFLRRNEPPAEVQP
jgi:hypothetical protein